MVFVGKLAYLFLFPGTLFIVAVGIGARAVTSAVGIAVAGPERSATTVTAPRILRAAGTECVAAGGSLHAAMWVAPVFKVLAISWASCIILGFTPGDLALLYVLLLAAAGSDVLFAFISPNPRVRQQAWPEAVSLLAWAVPMALVTACVALRTRVVSVSALIAWQSANGTPLTAQPGGVIAGIGVFLALAAAFFATVAITRLRPLGRGYLAGPGALMDDVSGPPLAFFFASDLAMLFVAPLVVVMLFFAGPAAHWYQVIFWALKVVGVLVLLGLVDVVSSRARANRVAAWGIGLSGALALAGLILTWIGVRA
ncbi:MAG: NADH-quinone oxidoreductase subunit H [Candidatus Geothermincolia bacterium]